MKNLYITLLTSLILVGCGGGGGGSGSGGGDSSSDTGTTPITTTLPEVVELDLTEGDEVKVSSDLNPTSNYDFKTYKTVSETFENSVDMYSGCSIMIYNDFEENNNIYKVSESNLILESFRSDCKLSGLDLTVSNSVENLLIVYSDGGDTKYEILNI